jgi:hypothetical protein
VNTFNCKQVRESIYVDGLFKPFYSGHSCFSLLLCHLHTSICHLHATYVNQYPTPLQRQFVTQMSLWHKFPAKFPRFKFLAKTQAKALCFAKLTHIAFKYFIVHNTLTFWCTLRHPEIYCNPSLFLGH